MYNIEDEDGHFRVFTDTKCSFKILTSVSLHFSFPNKPWAKQESKADALKQQTFSILFLAMAYPKNPLKYQSSANKIYS